MEGAWVPESPCSRLSTEHGIGKLGGSGFLLSWATETSGRACLVPSVPLPNIKMGI